MTDSKINSNEVKSSHCGKVISAIEAECPSCKTLNIRRKSPLPQKPINKAFDEINDAERKRQISKNKFGLWGMIILFIALMPCSINIYGQNPQIMPSLPNKNFLKIVPENQTFWEDVQSLRSNTVIEVACTVTKYGNTEKTRIIKVSPDQDLGYFAFSLTNNLSKLRWFPARTADGYACDSEIVLPIIFNENGKTSVRKLDAKWLSGVTNDSQNGNNNQRVWKQLPNHKIYKGEFAAFGLKKEMGTAKYQYIEKADGSRSFDGNFEYWGNNGFKAEGQFKNDYQVGQWTFKSNGRTAIVNFDDDGYPNGNFVLYEVHGSNITSNGVYMNGDVYTGKLYRGRFTEIKWCSSKGYNVVFQIDSYGDIYNGYVVGDNSIKWNRYRGFEKRDESTGDLEEFDIGKGYRDERRLGFDLQCFLLRSSSRRILSYLIKKKG